MFHTALTAGVPLRDAGDMSVDEIALCATARQENQKEFTQTLAWIGYNTAALTGVAVNDPKKFPSSLQQAFPGLFEEKNSEQQDWRVMKARIEGYKNMKESEV